MATKQNFLDRIPNFLWQEPVSDIQATATLLAARSADLGMTFEEAYHFIEGFVRHQNLISDESQQMEKGVRDVGWRWFRETLQDVTTFERHDSNGNLVGTKAQIVMGSRDDESTIDTDWIEVPSKYMALENAWDIALARTIKATAEEAIDLGADVTLCKHVFSGESGGKSVKIRKVIGMRIVWSSIPEDKPKKAASGSKGGSKKPAPADDAPTYDELVDISEDMGIDNLQSEDFEFLVEMLADNPNDETIFSEVEKFLDKVGDLEDNDEMNLLRYALLLMSENVD